MERRIACGRMTWRITCARDIPSASPAVNCPSLIDRIDPRIYSESYAELQKMNPSTAATNGEREIPTEGSPK